MRNKSFIIALIGGAVAGALLNLGNIPFTWHNAVFIGGALFTVYITGMAVEAAGHESG